MKIATHGNNMWGVVSWSGDVDGQAALITTSRAGASLWVFKYIPGGWFKSDKSYWECVRRFKNKDEAFKELNIAEEK